MFRSFAIAATLVVSAAFTAQAQTQDGGSGSATDLPLGQPAQQQPPQVETLATHGDWDVRCVTTPNGKRGCQLFQLLKEASGNPVAEASIFAAPQGQANVVAGGSIMTPLETLLPRNLAFAIDGGEAKTYPYVFCTVKGCQARLGFSAIELAALEKGTTATVTIYSVRAPQEPVVITMSLAGFTAAYDDMLAKSN